MIEWIKIYWNLLFSMEFFPMFEFYTLLMLIYFIIISMRLNRIESMLDIQNELSHVIIDEVE
mgnify:CR=1 FL=1